MQGSDATTRSEGDRSAPPATAQGASWGEPWADGPDDFLDDPSAGTAIALARRLEACRRELATWASLTMVARHPEVAPHRGVKGTRTLEADVDAVLRGLVAGLHDQDPDSLRRHARWYAAVLATRPAGEAALAVGLDTLHEGLLRWLGAPAAVDASVALASAYDRPMPATCAAWLAAAGDGEATPASS